jgi:peptidylprolyl isomerase
MATLAAVAALTAACGDTGSGGTPAPAADPGPALDAAPAPSPAAADAGPAKRQRTGPLSKRMEGALPAPPDVAAPPESAERSESGLAWIVLRKGRGGGRPGPYDVVTVDYTGWTADGINFDSSVVKGERAELPLSKVVKGWREGLQLMTKGEKRRFWIPEELAYQGRPNRPMGLLVFDIELHGYQKAPPLPPTPPDVAGPPPDAQKTASGVAWKVLRAGRGTERPGPTSEVTIAFTGWTTDGEIFRSTVLEGRPAIMPIAGIGARGLAEALQLMTKGETTRFWIPEELAYKGRPGGPEGMIVMDIEMLKIAN